MINCVRMHGREDAYLYMGEAIKVVGYCSFELFDLKKKFLKKKKRKKRGGGGVKR